LTGESILAEPIIRVVDLWKSYREDEGGNGAALRGVSLELARGEVFALMGKSGSGKTTLLNLLAGLDRPTRGLIEIEGRNLETLGEQGRTQMRRKRLGFVFQFFNLLPTLTAFENVSLPLELVGRADPAVARRALAQVGLGGLESRYPHELSGGEQQRVAIARALVKEPVLILADEPTGNLDTATGDQILELLTGQCRRAGMSLLMVTHTAMAGRYADRVLEMVDGAIAGGAKRDTP
jgi:putative ABC transport system ATP-binding protein